MEESIMRITRWSCLLALALVPIARGASVRQRKVMSFDPGWLFIQSDATGADATAFNDSAWTKVDVPHDWSIAGPFDQTNRTGPGGGFLPAGIGWYRKHFSLGADAAGQRVFITFDGVMANSDVYINGFKLGHRPYGYVTFQYELTDHVSFGPDKDNVIAVRCDNANQPASRWYTGAGIYRHVHLEIENPVHFDNWGVTVTTPKATADSATVHVHSTVINQAAAATEVQVTQTLLDPSGTQVAVSTPEAVASVAAGASLELDNEFTVASPKLWSTDAPNLYQLRTSVTSGGKTLDDQITAVGIRTAVFDSAKGFILNGKPVRIQGACLHTDAGAVGAAVPLDAWKRRLAALQSVGVDAVRCAHNPPSPEFLDLCDRMGILVMDELFDCWTSGKNTYDYHLFFNDWSLIDLRDTVRRDRNHPSIIIYSAGNEIPGMANAANANRILGGLVAEFHKYDPTRPVTQALLQPNHTPNGPSDYDDGVGDKLDVIGTNYRMPELLTAQAAKPGRKAIGTENNFPDVTFLANNSSLSGEFIWAGMDYLGEAGAWPKISDSEGFFDRTDTAKPAAYEFGTWWSSQPFVYITRAAAVAAGGRGRGGGAPTGAVPAGYGGKDANAPTGYPDWSPANTADHSENVSVFSNCDSVELFLNDKSLGAQSLVPTPTRTWANAVRKWTVPYAPGVLKAVGTTRGKPAVQEELHTAGKPAKIQLVADRGSLPVGFDYLSYVRATVTDDAGNLIFTATDNITFTIAGPGAVAAVDNGNNWSHEPFHATQRALFDGQCFALIKATAPAGQITITASAPGLTAATATLAAAPAP
jgi:beta-galactosidase